MKIGFIGMGNMASAIAGGVINSGFMQPQDVYAFDIDVQKLEKMQQLYQMQIVVEDEKTLVEQVDLVILAVKPNVIEEVLMKIGAALENKAIVSIIAGYDFIRYQQLLPVSSRHLTVMPNTPALVLEGMTLLEKEHSLTQEEFTFVTALFNSIGKTEVLPSYQMKAGGALSGCGPAFVYMMIEALADGAVSEGLPRDVAYRLASQTLIGAGTMHCKTQLHPGILKDSVCSPGGITIKGVQALEEHNFRAALIDAIKKAT